MKLTEIHANKANPRVMRDEKFRKLKKSIQEFPKMLALRPIVVDDSNTIVGGNMRYRALQDLGFKEIPSEWVKKAADLTEEEKKRFVIADNVNFGEWDYDLLANEWDNDLLLDWGLDTWKEPKDNEEEETEKDNADSLTRIKIGRKTIFLTPDEVEKAEQSIENYITTYNKPTGWLLSLMELETK